ncbi:hypothetical protein [Spirosoma utsteinense]|uniref:Uncharacterized protein n=1 Tax=Spirosoma utsteinense TaxID=2585773 RepID=A0ABR6WFX3_9BACT|nr:hypothetical protein [Spirosoma utsteinense]MBC3788915.1 hypothetical protein [Spirosoma utsteinense]MBC3794832.1 hypothetical protein [Spirosoma utsteinense]
MKLYSASFTAVVMTLIWVSLNLPDPGNNVNLTSQVNNVLVSKAKPMGASWSGTRPANSGYYNYGTYPVDASGIPDGGSIVVNYSAHDVPNRFYLDNNCGLTGSPQPWAVSNPSAYNGYVGSASYGGPWGMSISTYSGGQLSVQKRGGCNSWTLRVETSTSSISDYWTASY